MNRRDFVIRLSAAAALRPDTAHRIEPRGPAHRAPRRRDVAQDEDGIGTTQIHRIGAQALTDWLQRKHRIHMRPRFVEGEWEGVRVTPNDFTTLGEVDLFAAAIEEAATRRIAD